MEKAKKIDIAFVSKVEFKYLLHILKNLNYFSKEGKNYIEKFQVDFCFISNRPIFLKN